MKRIILIDTWNGDGYSDSGIIDLPVSWSDGVKSGLTEFNHRYLSMISDDVYGEATIEINTTNRMEYRTWSFYDGRDSGCIHLIEEDMYGVLIHPDENEVIVVKTKEEFDEIYNRIIDELHYDNEKEGFANDIAMLGNASGHTHQYEILYNLTQTI